MKPIRCLLLSILIYAPVALLSAQSSNDRIELMADALRARAAGDFAVAKDKLEQLLALRPDDENLRQLLDSVEEQIKSGENRYGYDLNALDAAVAAESIRQSGGGGSANTAQPVRPAGPRPSVYPTDNLDLLELARRGKAQFFAADYRPARMTFEQIESADPSNAEAKYFLTEIARILRAKGEWNRIKTKEEMLREVTDAWQRPQVVDREKTGDEQEEDLGLRGKLRQIRLPQISFNGVPLSRVVDTLSALSQDHDPNALGVNMVLIDPAGNDPSVTITLRNLTLERILDFTTESVGYEYDVQADAVVVRQGQGTATRLETDFFPLTRSTIIRLTGVGTGASGASSGPIDPFAPAASFSVPTTQPGEEEEALRNFLQRAGVPFENVDGANLALADGQLIVTQTPRNLEKVRNILRRYSEVKQVEIEARFLEVQEGDLEELGLNWMINNDFDPETGAFKQSFASGNRRLSDPFTIDSDDTFLSITSPDIGNRLVDQGAPGFPAAVDLGANVTTPLAKIAGVLGSAEVEVIVRALERQTGNDLMSAPRVTVLSGKTAEMVVAQELRYPERYGDVEAQVGRGDSSSGSAGVAITAGTPQDFVVRNVGVEMKVTPTVEDDSSISLLLEPQVTEFEGFVEYGGVSVAIASGTTVTVPSGFYQPIFSVRRVRTEVTIWDGATVVMGGLTREQNVSINDRVPVLGDLPLLGRLFRSEGESSQKRNLLIFVSANLVSPGGSPARQRLAGVEPASLFQNPVIVTPAGATPR